MSDVDKIPKGYVMNMVKIFPGKVSQDVVSNVKRLAAMFESGLKNIKPEQYKSKLLSNSNTFLNK